MPNFELQIPYAEYCRAQLATDPESTLAGFCVIFGPGAGVKICEKPDPVSIVIFGSSNSQHGLHERHCFKTNTHGCILVH